MEEFSKITDPSDVLGSQHFLQLNKIFLIHNQRRAIMTYNFFSNLLKKVSVHSLLMLGAVEK